MANNDYTYNQVKNGTGQFGANSRNAVIAFQEYFQLLPNGIVGQNTLVPLNKVSIGSGKSYFLLGSPLAKWNKSTKCMT